MAKIDFPVNAVGAETNISIQVNNILPTLPSQVAPPVFLSPVVDFGPHGLQFSEAATATLKLDMSQIPDENKKDITVVYFDENLGVWVPQLTMPNLAQNEVQFPITHFSSYAVALLPEIENLPYRIMPADPRGKINRNGEAFRFPSDIARADRCGQFYAYRGNFSDYVPTGHSYPYAQAKDGCSGQFSPKETTDSLTGWGVKVDFTTACYKHDECYYTQWFDNNSWTGSQAYWLAWNQCNLDYSRRLHNACHDGLVKEIPIETKKWKWLGSFAGYAAEIERGIKYVFVPAQRLGCEVFAIGNYTVVQNASAGVFTDAQQKQAEYKKWVEQLIYEWKYPPACYITNKDDSDEFELKILFPNKANVDRIYLSDAMPYRILSDFGGSFYQFGSSPQPFNTGSLLWTPVGGNLNEGLYRAKRRAGKYSINVGFHNGWTDANYLRPSSINTRVGQCSINYVPGGINSAFKTGNIGIYNCSSAAQMGNEYCKGHVNYLCRDIGYDLGRIMEVGNNEVLVSCYNADAVGSVPTSEITKFNRSCDPIGLGSSNYSESCTAGIVRFCNSNGYFSGEYLFGQTFSGAGRSDYMGVGCFGHQTQVDLGQIWSGFAFDSELKQKHPQCDISANDQSSECQAAYHRICTIKGFNTGFAQFKANKYAVGIGCIHAPHQQLIDIVR